MDNITEAIVIGEEAPRRGRRPAARSGAAPAPAVEQQAAGLVADLRRDSITMPRQELAQSLHMAGATGMIAAFQYNETANRVAMLKLFAQIRDSKAYKGASVVDRNGETRVVSTWEEFCTAHGYSRVKINEDLQNLAAFGRDSLCGSTSGEQWCVMEELKRRGFVPRSAGRSDAAADSPQARKIRSLWLTMADCGIVRDRSEKALENYVRRITGIRLGQATVKQYQTVIETLKAWLDRCDDPRIRDICRAILEQAEGAPAVLHGKTVVEARHGNLQ